MTTSKTNSAFTDNSVRVVAPMYGSLVSKHLAKSILNILRTKANVGAGFVERPHSTIKVVHNSMTAEQQAMEQRLGVSLHVLRSFLMGSSREGLPIDMLLRVQKEVEDELIFIDQPLLENAIKSSINHYLAHSPYEVSEFKKLKRNYDEQTLQV